MRECPESFTSRLNPGSSVKPVSWIEPQFSDNVKIVNLKKSHEPGSSLSAGEHLIYYEAKDASENKARCSFTITVLPPGKLELSLLIKSHSKSCHFALFCILHLAVNTAYNYPTGSSNYGKGTKPLNTEGTSSPKPEIHAAMRNVVCYVGKKGRRIVFQSVICFLA